MRANESVNVKRATTVTSLPSRLRELTATTNLSSIDVDIDAAPTHTDVDALRAFRRADIDVHWHGAVPALALEVMRERAPGGAGRIAMVANSAVPLVLSDSAGQLDKVNAAAGATLDVGTLVGRVSAVHGAFAARASIPADQEARAILVLGRAGWESKFVLAALSEAGWTVRASLATSPTVVVRDDNIQPIDTSRYDAVVIVDSSAADLAPAISRFVAEGGGLVAVAGSMELESLRALASAIPGDRRPGRILLAEDTVTPPDLPVRILASLRADAVPLEREAAGITLAARRAGRGRVLVVGYDESWRWRMLGGMSGLNAHRSWWARAVASVAPERGAVVESGIDAAPRAAILSALGDSSHSVMAGAETPASKLPLAFLIVISVALLVEIASRRFRGER